MGKIHGKKKQEMIKFGVVETFAFWMNTRFATKEEIANPPQNYDDFDEDRYIRRHLKRSGDKKRGNDDFGI